MRKSSIKRIASCLLAAAMVGLTACGSPQSEPPKTVTVIVKAQQHEFWDVVNKGAADAGEEIGCSVDLQSTENESQVDVQIELMNNAINNKSDAIVVAPINKDALSETINKAVANGIKVITIDTRVEVDGIPYIGTDNQGAGAVAGREARKLLGSGSGKIAVVALTEVSPSSIGRVAGFRSEVETEGSGNTIVDIKYCDANTEVAKSQALELISKYPDLEMIYGVNQNSTEGICQAVSESGKTGKIKVIGFNASAKEIDFIQRGVLSGVVVQNPYNMGYLGVRNSIKLINGHSIPNVTDTGATFVSPANIDDETIQQILYPMEQ